MTGSPPPMRGKGAYSGDYVVDIRITPAYAGKSKKFWIVIIFIKDHPRLCGEKTMNHLPRQAFIGSPPPMRGKGFACMIFSVLPGITPAYAGKSLRSFLHRET